MSVQLSELLGDELLQHDPRTLVPSSEVNGKIVALYFSFVRFESLDRWSCSRFFSVPSGVHRAATSLPNSAHSSRTWMLE